MDASAARIDAEAQAGVVGSAYSGVSPRSPDEMIPARRHQRIPFDGIYAKFLSLDGILN
ncbi:hypothetical protein [Paraburkholderia oxyphila]|uniref:hypothetical protein n=1 Tax=Paraburkholderia oxyphila TaxID=614212 RepID=UPI0012EE6126|nr:hypothetical protein [Paraburkholderia oxyphila]